MPRNPDKIDDSHGFPEDFEVFPSISDPRDGAHTLHHFGEILFIAFVGVLCGVRSYKLMEEFGEPREDRLRKWLKLPNPKRELRATHDTGSLEQLLSLM